jgi:hypothetical protein
MATVNSKGEKMVKIRLFKDRKSYTEDVFVSVNGRTFQIKRGVEVEVPDYVAEVLQNSQKQDDYAIDLMSELQQGASGW